MPLEHRGRLERWWEEIWAVNTVGTLFPEKPSQRVLKNKIRCKRLRDIIYSGKLVLQRENNGAGQH